MTEGKGAHEAASSGHAMILTPQPQLREEIQHWLDATEPNTEQLSPADPALKRRRLHPPITPPCPDTRPNSPGDDPSKRPLDDETPRPKRVQTNLSERSYASLSSASSDRSSPRSGRSTLQRQLLRLQLNPRGLEVRSMYDTKYRNSRPQTLQTLLHDIRAFSDGQGIVSKDAQDALVKAASLDDRFTWALQHGASHVSDDKGLDGRTPPPGAVHKVMNATFECDTKLHPEANWNLEVHQRILDIAFRPTEESNFENLIDFMGSTTASIIPEYGIPTLFKKVDFCIYIEPKNDSLLSPAFLAGASNARASMPQGVLNFTDFAPLNERFVALSIETKKPSEDFKAAQLQLGVWDMARWAFLRRLVELLSGTEADDIAEVKLPEFLPGLIVQGDNWFLTVTTMEGDKTVLWQKVAIGSTSDPRGVYQIVRTLQYLEHWAKDVHWPWLRAIIEGMSGDAAATV